jgi:hypothetical protein
VFTDDSVVCLPDVPYLSYVLSEMEEQKKNAIICIFIQSNSEGVLLFFVYSSGAVKETKQKTHFKRSKQLKKFCGLDFANF